MATSASDVDHRDQRAALMPRRRIAVLGGTFDPIHIGHLRSALELRDQLELDEVRLMPAHVPPLRDMPGATSEQRLAMVRLAIAEEPGLLADARELQRSGPSYTVDTLASLRAEMGPDAVLCFALGSDAFAGLDRWQNWPQLLGLAHLLVLRRPGEELPTSGPVATLWQQHRVAADQLAARPAGSIVALTLTQLPVSATAVRALISSGRSPRYLLPDSVWHYIRKHGLYGYGADSENRSALRHGLQ